jgi:hypothetical protein
VRPMLLGEAPSRSGDRYWRFPLSGTVARTLCKMADIPPEDEGSRYGVWTWALYDRFECVNVFERYAQATPWSAPRARERVASMEMPPVVVLLGRKVQAAFCLRPLDFFEWAHEGARSFVVIPHPSGLNRVLNDPEQRAMCGCVLNEASSLARL